MAASDNRGLLDRYLHEVWDQADSAAVRRFLSPGFTRHISPYLPVID